MKKKLNRLKNFRQGYGLKIERVCRDTNISYSSMRQYECGYRTPRLETMKILSDYYHKSINELFLETVYDYFILNELKMLTQDDVASLLNIHRTQVSMLRQVRILKAIKTGKNYIFLKNKNYS